MDQTDGLLFALRVDPEGRVHEEGWPAADDAVEDGGFLWLHLDAQADAAGAWLRTASGIDPIVQEALLAEETRPRCVAHGNALLLMLRAINLTPGDEPDDMVSLRIHAEQRRIVTLRRRPVRTIEHVRERLAAGRVEPDAGAVLVAITDQLSSYIGEAVASIEDLTDALEDELLSTPSREVRTRISDLRRTMIAYRRFLAPQRDALARLSTERLAWLSDAQRARLREVADRAIRHVEELDEAREHASVAYEELAGRLTERVEQRMYVLSLVAAVFLPLGFVTGLLGINVGGMPGTDDSRAFTIVVVACLGLAVGLVLFLKRRRWL